MAPTFLRRARRSLRRFSRAFRSTFGSLFAPRTPRATRPARPAATAATPARRSFGGCLAAPFILVVKIFTWPFKWIVKNWKLVLILFIISSCFGGAGLVASAILLPKVNEEIAEQQVVNQGIKPLMVRADLNTAKAASYIRNLELKRMDDGSVHKIVNYQIVLGSDISQTTLPIDLTGSPLLKDIDTRNMAASEFKFEQEQSGVVIAYDCSAGLWFVVLQDGEIDEIDQSQMEKYCKTK